MTKKERIIESIALRILTEKEKHSQLDWAKIAAYKIYAEHLEVEKKADFIDWKQHMICARATLFPNKTLEEVEKILSDL